MELSDKINERKGKSLSLLMRLPIAESLNVVMDVLENTKGFYDHIQPNTVKMMIKDNEEGLYKLLKEGYDVTLPLEVIDLLKRGYERRYKIDFNGGE